MKMVLVLSATLQKLPFGMEDPQNNEDRWRNIFLAFAMNAEQESRRICDGL